jgi:hypothetical protein
MTRPITPVSRPGVPSGGTYVVCLDCAKQFEYDWERMKIGKAIPRPVEDGVLPADLPRRRNPGVKYALLGSALPLAVMLGKTLLSKRRPPSDTQRPRPSAEDKPET